MIQPGLYLIHQGNSPAAIQAAEQVYDDSDLLYGLSILDTRAGTGNMELANQLAVVEYPTLIFVNQTETGFVTITRLTGANINPVAIYNVLEYIYSNEQLILNAQGNSNLDVFDGNAAAFGNGGNGLFNSGNFFNVNLPWWLWFGVAVLGGMKTAGAKNTGGRIAWGALATYGGIMTGRTISRN